MDTTSKITGASVVHTPIRGTAMKVEHTIKAVALPLAQSGVSTVTCVLPLLFLPTYSSMVFVTAISLVVTFGTVHSLVVSSSIGTKVDDNDDSSFPDFASIPDSDA
ncbi:hypothetical protein GCK32_021382 [Trichostrongylus colubriformis]|uniref:Transmembrane protein n=1 Tax=Trichostrongylus colubriformis TaxID=6319 RepID=A0AAN8EU82_TRICO